MSIKAVAICEKCNKNLALYYKPQTDEYICTECAGEQAPASVSMDGIAGTDGTGPANSSLGPDASDLFQQLKQSAANDKVTPLFRDQPTAAGVPPQDDVVSTLNELLELAKSGKLVGLLVIGMDGFSQSLSMTCGKIRYSDVICGLEEVKLRIISNHLMQEALKSPKK